MESEGRRKNIRVKVEDIATGEIVKDFSCGGDGRRAGKLEESLNQRVNLDKYPQTTGATLFVVPRSELIVIVINRGD
jgi:hypothetical protein